MHLEDALGDYVSKIPARFKLFIISPIALYYILEIKFS